MSPNRVTYNTSRPVSVERRESPVEDKLLQEGYEKAERGGMTVYVKRADRAHTRPYTNNYTTASNTSPRAYQYTTSSSPHTYNNTPNYPSNNYHVHEQMEVSLKLPEPVNSYIGDIVEDALSSATSGSPKVMRYDVSPSK